MYKHLAKLVLIIFVITGCSSDYKNINDCKSLGTLELICNLQNPEDFAKIPEENSIVVSQFAGLPELNEGKVLIGKLSKLDLKTNEIEESSGTLTADFASDGNSLTVGGTGTGNILFKF